MPVKYGIIKLTCDRAPYSYFDAIKKEYYSRKEIPFCFLFNEKRDREKDDTDLVFVSDCESPQGIPVMLEKFLWSISVLRDRPGWNECDYWIRTNASTFINLEVLEGYLERLPRSKCYAGSICDGEFISGTCIIFSRDVVIGLTRIDASRQPFLYDDLVIHRLMSRRFIRMRDLPMRFFVDNAIHGMDEIAAALREAPLLRINNAADRERFDFDVWTKIASLKGVRVPSRKADDPAGVRG